MATNDADLYYSFDDADLTGSNPDDISGNGNNGTNNGATTGATGKINEGFDLNGTTDWIDSISKAWSTNELAFVIWFNADALSANMTLWGYAFGSGGDILSLRTNSSGQLNLSVRVNGGSDTFVTAGSLSTGTWYQAIVNLNASNVAELFLDNSSLGTTTKTGNLASHDIDVGRRANTGNQYFNGKLDEFAIYDHVLNSSDRSSLYNGGSGNNPYATTGTTSNSISYGGGL